MTMPYQWDVLKALAVLVIAGAAARAGDWTPAVEVRYEDQLCVAYQARLDGAFLVVRAAVGPGWHTFAMDNKQRAEEKLAGKPAISMDRSTEITPAAGWQTVGPWYQSPPKDFSRPALRWFSWGFDHEALFVAKIRRTAATATRLALRGQACTETICKNIDISIPLPRARGGETDAGASSVDWKALVPVR